MLILYLMPKKGLAIQLRDKEASKDELIQIGKSLHAFLKPLRIPLIINDHIEVAVEVGAEGVHLGQKDASIKRARELLGKKAIIGLSVETIEQAIIAQNEDVTYLAASPVFSTKTKNDCKAPWGLDDLKKLCALSKHPVIAIGGINEASVKKVMESGVLGVAIVSAIFDAPSPNDAALRIISKMMEAYA